MFDQFIFSNCLAYTTSFLHRFLLLQLLQTLALPRQLGANLELLRTSRYHPLGPETHHLKYVLPIKKSSFVWNIGSTSAPLPLERFPSPWPCDSQHEGRQDAPSPPSSDRGSTPTFPSFCPANQQFSQCPELVRPSRKGDIARRPSRPHQSHWSSAQIEMDTIWDYHKARRHSFHEKFYGEFLLDGIQYGTCFSYSKPHLVLFDSFLALVAPRERVRTAIDNKHFRHLQQNEAGR